VKLAYIWYHPPEREKVTRSLGTERPDWHVDCLHEPTVTHLYDAIQMLRRRQHSARAR
jgi:hypothetical protein